MRFKYEDLEIWQLALDLIKVIYDVLRKFPKDEKYDLVSQGKRAVVSVALNIAEGSGRQTNKDFASFLNRSVTSLQEVDGVLKIGIKLGYITADDCSSADALIEKEYFKALSFEKSLRRNSAGRRQ
jgi:four helix bundle protein